ncbi:hypothetical protein KIM372_12800 [Bombiscardovia nodaiensis]|uniref:PIN domain-containing protein n=1 Tax=Bombiscardovia nodaiensis TaxID=2932181 RepID=A0ABM8B9U5_9BIFI|nr:hypothetical protein KIM372_12800 [Bombiscardovia nodaiensis]
MRLLVDCNVFLDVFLEREGLYQNSALLLSQAKRLGYELIMPAHAAPNILYVVSKNKSRTTALSALSQSLAFASVGALDESAILRGLSYGFNDIEDSFVAAIAQKAKADYVVTNNIKDFALSPIPAVTPAEFLARMAQES